MDASSLVVVWISFQGGDDLAEFVKVVLRAVSRWTMTVTETKWVSAKSQESAGRRRTRRRGLVRCRLGSREDCRQEWGQHIPRFLVEGWTNHSMVYLEGKRVREVRNGYSTLRTEKPFYVDERGYVVHHIHETVGEEQCGC
jgi:hypothetical protein